MLYCFCRIALNYYDAWVLILCISTSQELYLNQKIQGHLNPFSKFQERHSTTFAH